MESLGGAHTRLYFHEKNQLMRPLIVLTAACLLFSACKKEVEGTTTAPATISKTNKDYLTSGRWLLTETWSSSITNRDTNYVDRTPYLAECSKDDLLIFNTDGREVINFGANLCPGQPAIDSLRTWSMPNDKQIKEIQGGPGAPAVLIDILEINASMLKIAMGSYDKGNSRITNTYTNLQ